MNQIVNYSWEQFNEEYHKFGGILLEDSLSTPGFTIAEWYSKPTQNFLIKTDPTDQTIKSKLQSTILELDTIAKSGKFVVGGMYYEAGYYILGLENDINIPKDTKLLESYIFSKRKIIKYPNPALKELEKANILNMTIGLSESDYKSKISKLKEYLISGESYQLNFCFKNELNIEGNLFHFYQLQKRKQKTKYSAYIPFFDSNVLSFSPELFCEIKGGFIKTEPMKGTIPRGEFTEKDNLNRSELANSEKDKAENVMITDLFRNDLGKISETGSVETKDLFEIKPLDTVWQMVSTVEGKLKPNFGLLEIIFNLFPSGSVTGAPKKNSMYLLNQLENHPRELYTGSIFRLFYDTNELNFRGNVAIRTIEYNHSTKQAKYGIGSGVTVLSDSKLEYSECLSKLQFLQSETFPDFEILETFRFFNGRFRLLNPHLNRMRNSAHRFSIPFNLEKAMDTLESIANVSEGLLRVRLLLNQKGEFRAESYSLVRTNKNKSVTLLTSKNFLAKNNVFFYHKTTNRRFYENELFLAQQLGCEDSILFDEEGNVCETNIRNIFYQIDGKWYTPALENGGLKGVFRNYLVKKGWVKEMDIKLPELLLSQKILVGNSLRGLEKVTIKQNT
ncbi:bifunctional anthranilate synthase component I family protein/class IV aminotransferase [Leptospira sp. 96542]|nr:bifunctional anthranilate synthase component I family protein/class IV aminotransferase [Leptospira sp. 96542]